MPTRKSIVESSPDYSPSLHRTRTSISVKHKYINKGPNNEDRPNPLDFDAYLSWVCVQWQCPKPVLVRSITQEYVSVEDRMWKSSLKSRKSFHHKRHDHDSGRSKTDASDTSQSEDVVFTKTVKENNVTLTAYYDLKKRLIKVAFTETSEVPIKVIEALSLCLHYHALLTSLSFQNGLSSQHLYEISKLLPFSNITDLRLSDCYIPEGNYYLLLEQISDIKFLSLSRCSINDLVCKELVSRLEVGASGSRLLSLELASNCISDVGAEYIAQVLRLNRTLLHLNLSDNKLTDKGAKIILTQLIEFRLTVAEMLDRMSRKRKYLECKCAVYQKCFEELQQKQFNTEIKRSASVKTLKSDKSSMRQKWPIKGNKGIKLSVSSKSLRPKKSFNKKDSGKSFVSNADLAENDAMNIVGNFIHPFECTGIHKKDGYWCYIGNMVLCSLNIAYNNVSYLTIKQICKVLKYQQKKRQSFGKTGLLRIVFEGNPIPKTCAEYFLIKDLLMDVILDRAPIFCKRRTKSINF